jgi:hypothetical protein
MLRAAKTTSAADQRHAFGEARGYPAWIWMIGSAGAGLIITITYIAFLRWV